MKQDALPLVSVVMATYNGSAYLKQQLDSIIGQTYPNLEIIVVDDCSTDTTVKILETYAQQHRHLRYWVNEKNLGYVKNFEKGLGLVSGEFVAPSDQDDIWLSNKIEVLMAHIGDDAIIYCDSELIDGSGEKMGKKMSEIKRLATFDNCLNYTIGNSAAGHAMIIRREVVNRSIPMPTMIPHDYWIGLMATFESRLKFFDQPLVLYRQHEQNVFGLSVKGLQRESKRQRKLKTKPEHEAKALERIKLIYEICPAKLETEKEVFRKLCIGYQSHSFNHNWIRLTTFLNHRDAILAFKRRSQIRKILFCIKMFFKIE